MLIKISNEVKSFILSLEENTIAKVFRVIDLLEFFGYKLGMPHSKKIKDNLHELRIRGRQEVRIFYLIKNEEILLLFGYIKKTQKIPRLIMKKIEKYSLT